MSELAIPKAVDEALAALARRRGLPKDLGTLVFSVGRHAIRAFSGDAVNTDEVIRMHDRLARCLKILADDPGVDADGSLAHLLRALVSAVDDACASPAPPAPVAAGRAPRPSGPMPTAGPPPAVLRPPPVALPRAELPRFMPRAQAAEPPPAAPAPAPARRVPPPPVEIPALPVPEIRPFPATAAAAVERDWYWFVLEELNGLGGLLAFQRREADADGAARTERRVRATLDTLAWDGAATVRQTWDFVMMRLRDDDDGWGPHLVLRALEPETDRVRDWVASLSPEMHAVIADTPFETARGSHR